MEWSAETTAVSLVDTVSLILQRKAEFEVPVGLDLSQHINRSFIRYRPALHARTYFMFLTRASYFALLWNNIEKRGTFYLSLLYKNTVVSASLGISFRKATLYPFNKIFQNKRGILSYLTVNIL